MTTNNNPRYHLVLSRPFDLNKFEQNAEADKCPHHTMGMLARALNAIVHEPGQDAISASDLVMAKIGGSQPEHWALARALSQQFGSNDIVFTIGEDSGFPIAAICGAQPNRPKISVFAHNVDRPRSRMMMKWFNLAERIDLFLTNTTVKAEFLQQYLKLHPERIYLVTEQTDAQFFTPGPTSAQKNRPIIGSGGLEQRDYRTLAQATQDLDVDVKVCAVSPNAKAIADTFPDVMPQNMSRGYYDWPDLRQLYRDSDVVVISLKSHNYQAGFTTLFEAMACRRPVIMTRTPGLAEQLADEGIITGVQAGDAAGMRQAILHLLNHPEEAAAQAQRGYELVLEKYNSQQYVEGIAQQLIALQEQKQSALVVS